MIVVIVCEVGVFVEIVKMIVVKVELLIVVFEVMFFGLEVVEILVDIDVVVGVIDFLDEVFFDVVFEIISMVNVCGYGLWMVLLGVVLFDFVVDDVLCCIFEYCVVDYWLLVFEFF